MSSPRSAGARFARGSAHRGADRAGGASGRGRARFARPAGAVTLVCLAFVAGAPAPTALAAQAADSVRLTFEEAVRVALENNPSYQRDLYGVASSEYGERQSLGQAFLPSLSGGLSFGGGWSRRQTGEDDLGRPIGGSDFQEYTSSSASQSLSGSVPLLDLGSIRSYAAAREQTIVRAAATEYQAALLRTQVGQAYFGVVQRERLIDVEERNLETARQSLAAVRQLLRIAARQPTDVLGAELQVAQAEQSVAEAVGEARKARLQLQARMGVPLQQRFTLTTSFPEVFDPAALDSDALVGRALRESPRMTQQAAAVGAAEVGLSAARAGRFPILRGTFGYSRSVGMQGYDALGRFDLPDQGWNFGLSASLPLFTQLGTSARIGQASVGVLEARESLREARLELELEVRGALIDLENAHAAVVLAERQVELGRERLRQGQELYRVGTLDFTDLQTMIDQLSGYERGLTTARYRFTEALLQLEEKVGGPVRDDTAP